MTAPPAHSGKATQKQCVKALTGQSLISRADVWLVFPSWFRTRTALDRDPTGMSDILRACVHGDIGERPGVTYSSRAMGGTELLLEAGGHPRRYVFLRTDNPMAIAYINRHYGVPSTRLLRLPKNLWVWASNHLLSLRALHVPVLENKATDPMYRGGPFLDEWWLHPTVMKQIRICTLLRGRD